MTKESKNIIAIFIIITIIVCGIFTLKQIDKKTNNISIPINPTVYRNNKTDDNKVEEKEDNTNEDKNEETNKRRNNYSKRNKVYPKRNYNVNSNNKKNNKYLYYILYTIECIIFGSSITYLVFNNKEVKTKK